MRLFNSILLFFSVFLVATAQASETGIKYRQNQMAAMGGHMGSIAALLKGEVDFIEQLPAHARALADTAAFTESVFKEQATSNQSTAKATIWTDWERFSEYAETLQLATAKLAQAAADEDQRALRRAMSDVGRACKSCHDRFRERR